MRYTVVDRGHGHWCLDGTPAIFISKAQAEICAFALNAIAKGHQLSEVVDLGEMPLDIVYNGPTEGVAPA